MNPKRILIVDDVPAMRLLLRNALAEHQVSEASTGKGALELIQAEEPPELILLDQSLGDMSGLEILKETKEIRQDHSIKVCFVTGHRDRETVVNALALGANDYIVKPVDLVMLKSKIETMFGGSAERFASVRTRLSAQIKDLPMDVDLIVQELSESGLTFACDLKFQTGKNIVLDCPVLNEKLSINGIMIRIDSVTKIKNGFAYKTMFVGLTEATGQKIRQYTQRGQELRDDIERESKF